jgi:hypothetical protein
MATVPGRTYRDFSTRRIVIQKSIDRRLGFNSTAEIEGWKWDSRYVVEDQIAETLPFPGLKRSRLMGLPRKYWQNGPISGKTGNSIKVEGVEEFFGDGKTRWVPVIHNGNLNIWRDSTYFFSDDSVIDILDASSIDSGGRSIHILSKNLRPQSPILATIYRRDVDNEYLPWRNYTGREVFTGTLDSNGDEQLTRDGDTFYWSNVDTTKREFVPYVRDDYVNILFNQFVVEQITSVSAPVVLDDFNDLEYLGTSDGSDDQTFTTSKFPLSNDAFLKIYLVDTTTLSWVSYTIVTQFTGVNQVKVDYDLGILTFGTSSGLTAPPTLGHSVYIAYRAVPRIEYEEDGFREVSYVGEADISPLNQSMNKGFITLARTELDINSITLETTKPSYPGITNAYGPVYIGSDFASLLATVYSSSGEVIPNAEVTFYFETSPSFGGLSGGFSSIQRRTGFNGIAKTYYVPPVSIESIGFYVTSVDPGNILTLPGNANFSNVQDVYTYYVLKDDPTIGIAAADTSKGEVEWSSTSLNGRKVIFYKWDSTSINPISGHSGAYRPVRPLTITTGNVLTYSDTLETPDINGLGSAANVGFITSSLLGSVTDSIKVWTVNEWNGCVIYSSSLNEYKRIVSNTATTINILGEWSDIPTGSFTIFNRASNLGSYWVISDRLISLRASVYSPRLGKTIYSNELSLRVEIPAYMKGSYINNSLLEIPFGWRILSDSYTQASAINGATYISINPIAGPYPIVDVIGEEDWDLYSGYDFESPYPFWPYSGVPIDGATSPAAMFTLYWTVV